MEWSARTWRRRGRHSDTWPHKVRARLGAVVFAVAGAAGCVLAPITWQAFSSVRPLSARTQRSGVEVAAQISGARAGIANGVQSRRLVDGHRPSSLIRHAGERTAYISIVDVNVTPGTARAFFNTTLPNARASLTEPTNLRFDILQNRDDPKQFALFEMYSAEEGPKDHKNMDHYKTWRDAVAGYMACPRKALHYDTVFPRSASDLAPKTVLLERAFMQVLDITVVQFNVATKHVEQFKELTLDMVETTSKESEALNIMFLHGPDDDRNQFAVISCYRTEEAYETHTQEAHFKKWRRSVNGMMNEKRVTRKFRNLYPNLIAGWKA